MVLYLVIAFAGVALTLIAVPGPDRAFILVAGTQNHIVLPAVAGLMIGYMAITTAIAVGLGPLVTAVPSALMALTFVGAAYLIYLGTGVLGRPGGIERATDGQPSAPRRRRMLIAKGIGVSALNPKGLLIFLAILPQFTRSGQGWPIAVQFAVLGTTFTLICGLFYLALGYAANRIVESRPNLARTTTRIAGVAMIVVGLVLVIERIIEMSRH